MKAPAARCHHLGNVMDMFAQVLEFIQHPATERFEEIARRVFAYQFERIEPYRIYCLGLGASPATVRTLADIPPISTAAFKHATLGSEPPERIFLTSGTSRGKERRGRHPIPRLEVYRASALAHLRRMLFPDAKPLRMLVTHPTAERMPESSLAQMLSWAIEAFGNGINFCCATPRGLDLDAGAAFLGRAEADEEAVCILGTTASFSALFDFLRNRGARFRLAPGSRLMDTGGAKGQITPLEPAEVLSLAGTYLGIAPEFAINEYGMTELCSQLYDATPLNFAPSATGARAKLAPPWMAVMVRDPVTMRPVAAGEAGLLCFFDLANVGSVSALMTEDLGTIGSNGLVTIHGRTLSGDPRGCALGIEQFATVVEQNKRPLPRDAARPEPSPASIAPEELNTVAARLSALPSGTISGDRMAQVLGGACCLWQKPDYPRRRRTIAAIAEKTGQGEAMLQASLDAVLRNFTADRLATLARRLPWRERLLVGFIMPGNVVGAGLHELVQALIAGASAIIKPSSAEPFFFAEFARTIAELDPDAGQRLAVVNFGRGETDNARAMSRLCNLVVALGDDDTIAAVATIAGDKLIDFGARMSAGLIAREALPQEGIAAAVARDVSLCDQRGCLSLHHLFVEGTVEQVRSLARQIAFQLDVLARLMPPGVRLRSSAASARAVREDARWRAMTDGATLWNGGSDLAWTVICEPDEAFKPSPLCRTLRIGTISELEDLEARLGPAAGRIEGLAVADPARRAAAICARLREAGVSYFCPPGELQSPPPSWEHGGGRFLRLLRQRDG